MATVGTNARGGVDLEALRALLADDVAGIMLTNPSTLGLFEDDIVEIATAVHDAGGLLYYDGANLNAILGIVRPGDMGFDIVHLNVHKTFATPHGGPGPGRARWPWGPSSPPSCPARGRARAANGYELATPERSIGRVHSWHGNAVVLLRAWMYLRLNGGDGLRAVSQMAVLNANWFKERLRRRRRAGSCPPPGRRRCGTARRFLGESGQGGEVLDHAGLVVHRHHADQQRRHRERLGQHGGVEQPVAAHRQHHRGEPLRRRGRPPTPARICARWPR